MGTSGVGRVSASVLCSCCLTMFSRHDVCFDGTSIICFITSLEWAQYILFTGLFRSVAGTGLSLTSPRCVMESTGGFQIGAHGFKFICSRICSPNSSSDDTRDEMIPGIECPSCSTAASNTFSLATICANSVRPCIFCSSCCIRISSSRLYFTWSHLCCMSCSVLSMDNFTSKDLRPAISSTRLCFVALDDLLCFDVLLDLELAWLMESCGVTKRSLPSSVQPRLCYSTYRVQFIPFCLKIWCSFMKILFIIKLRHNRGMYISKFVPFSS